MIKTIRHQDSNVAVSCAKLLMGYERDRAELFDADFVAYVCAWQRTRSLEPDGIIGAKTWTAISESALTLSTAKNSRSPQVWALQTLLGGIATDGIFGSKTKAAVAAFQSSAGLTADGICGAKTWKALITGQSDTDKPIQSAKQPVIYRQYDSRWGSIIYTKNNTYNRNQTIKNSGCGITSAAMVIATWWDKSITPKETAADAVKNGYRTENSGTSWGYFKHVAEKYKASKFVQTGSFSTAEACIRAGGLVVVSVGKSIWTKSGHFVLLWKVDGNNVYINDPASSASNRAKNTIATLKAASKQYFCFFR